MAGSLLEGDMEVSVVMTVSLFQCHSRRQFTENVVRRPPQKDKTKCQISEGWYRSHTYSAGWKCIHERHRGFEIVTMISASFVLQIYHKVNFFGLSNSLSKCLTWQLSQMHSKHRREGPKFNGKYLLHHSWKGLWVESHLHLSTLSSVSGRYLKKSVKSHSASFNASPTSLQGICEVKMDRAVAETYNLTSA